MWWERRDPAVCTSSQHEVLGEIGRGSYSSTGSGAARGVTLVDVLMAVVCFLNGCCGSPMLGMYAGIIGARALVGGMPLMAGVTLLSVGHPLLRTFIGWKGATVRRS
jgi:hypothetical protein